MRTFGYYALALQQVAVVGESETGLSGDVFQLVARSSPVSKTVLLVLVLFSVFSWGTILFKVWQFRKIESQTKRFLEIFRQSSKFSEVQSVCQTLPHSPLVGLFQAGYVELNTQLHQDEPPNMQRHDEKLRPSLKSFNSLNRSLLRATGIEVRKLEKRVPFLATTASLTPFIGLFGTVWGIINAFQGIAATGSSSLGVVAPGIAEALVATAAGLFAAIPAVYFYNNLIQRVKVFVSEMEDFSLEFLNIAERNFS